MARGVLNTGGADRPPAPCQFGRRGWPAAHLYVEADSFERREKPGTQALARLSAEYMTFGLAYF